MTPAAAASGTIKSTSAASENLSRYQKIRHRLEWKLKHLVDGYRQATSTAADATVEKLAFAEQMFKLDFYEYYSYLERGIVHLLLVFGLRVSGSSASSSGPRRRWGDDDDEDSNRGGYTHRYHANVLDALRDPDSPFYEVLGSGERFAQLQKAKELRNRWKYADMTPEERERDPQTWRAAYKAWKDARTPLARYDFDHMLIQILKGLAEAAELAQQRLDEVSRRAGEDTDDDSDSDDSDVSDEYDFMVDAMDWEAV
ncbi:uncharacterized protein BO97DRAFT_343024 [Aspergillus homomorphus CBS 101889]|uniref:Uncharacterized protein n=1 Tax=Aspergillus homomorphus (strain CBS 101889) TaxID=1450537 RepID=A0A395I043_ASPHC|nr:hypothetical protein BO97DRAFT_343024 [Aspergillus homomorphus CBS 101889]RAL13420.1 hypothetical protein BO97DRAFT_343024 [Aspergillus homomorphus CBS 101889]